MRNICAIILLAIFSSPALAQTKNEKIKVILLGTIHFGATSDKNSTQFPDLLSDKRQEELEKIASALNKYGVDKFFLETQVSRQKWQDSLFNSYKAGQLTAAEDINDERVQIAFRTAIKNNTPMVAVDYKQELPYDKINAYEKEHKNDTISKHPFFDQSYPFTEKRKKLAELSLPDYYIQLNNKYSRLANMFDYLHYALAYGEDADYTGENFTAVHYDRNLKIFTNILRQINPKTDKVIVVLFGSSHTTMLRQFFENHPMFEIIELADVFK